MNPFVLVLGLVLEANPASRGRERGRRRGRRDGSWVGTTDCGQLKTGYRTNFFATIVALWPPKPKELLMIALIVISRAVFGTQSKSHCASEFSCLIVGAATFTGIACW